MNKVVLIGRLVEDPFIVEKGTAAKYRLAVDSLFRREDRTNADFINCVVFGKSVEFVQKYLKKGMKIAVDGWLHTGSYTDKNAQTIYTTDVVVNNHEFVERKELVDEKNK